MINADQHLEPASESCYETAIEKLTKHADECHVGYWTERAEGGEHLHGAIVKVLQARFGINPLRVRAFDDANWGSQFSIAEVYGDKCDSACRDLITLTVQAVIDGDYNDKWFDSAMDDALEAYKERD